MSARAPQLEIAPGVWMPMLGQGTWPFEPVVRTRCAVGWALEAGYRHIDTAPFGNEADVGAALAASGVDRDELFVTAKSPPSTPDVREGLLRSLERLGLAHVDAYLVHWPPRDPRRHWEQMQEVLGEGLTRAIGASDFGVLELRALARHAEVAPAVDHVSFSPYAYRRGLLEECANLGVTLVARSPLARGAGLGHALVRRIAAAHGRTPAQVVLRWALERDVPVLPASGSRERVHENSHVFEFALTIHEITALDALDLTGASASAL